jgi:hypothetical protein
LTAAAERDRGTSLRRPERLLPLSCLAAAVVLGASELMTTFQVSATGNVPLCTLQGADRHHLAQLLLAAFGGFSAIVAVLGGSRPAARATAAAGVIALLLFLIIDLPHANNVGSVSASCDLAASDVTAKAIPQAGFWLELLGSLGLAASGLALAALSPRQLHSLRPRWLVGSGTPPADGRPAPSLRRRLRRPVADENPGPAREEREPAEEK